MNNKGFINKEEILYFGFFSLVMVGKSIGLNADSKLLQIITIIALILLAVKLLITSYTRKQLGICFWLMVIGLGSYFVTKREGVLLSILSIIGIKGIPYKKIFSLAFKLRLVIFISMITLSYCGVINNVKITHWRDGVGLVNRYGLGYDHPNALHNNFFILVVLFIYLNYERLNIKKYIFILITNLLIYNFSVSRTGLYAVIALVITTIIFKKKKNINKLEYKMILWILPICIIFTIVTALTYNKIQLTNQLDKILTGRIHYSNYFLTNYNINLLGYNLSKDTNLLDNSYVVLLVNYGLVVFGLYILAYYKIIKEFIKLKMDKELLIICFFLIYGITEGYLPNLFLNLSLVFLGDLIFNNIRIDNI